MFSCRHQEFGWLVVDYKGWGSVYIKADDFRLKYCIEGGFSKITSTKEGLHRLCRQNGTSSSGGRKPISGNQSKKRDGTPFKNLGVEITFPTPLVFPNCFHITLGKPKFPLIFFGKSYTSLLYIFAKYFLSFNRLHFSSCTIHTEEITGSHPVRPPFFPFAKLLLRSFPKDLDKNTQVAMKEIQVFP